MTQHMAIPDPDTENISPAEFTRMVARAQHCGWSLSRSRTGYTLRGPSGTKHLMDVADVARAVADLKRSRKRGTDKLEVSLAERIDVGSIPSDRTVDSTH